MKNITLRNRPDQYQHPLPVPDCTHHFVIAEPNGTDELPGICKRCGAEKVFRPFGNDNPWKASLQ